MYNYIGNDTEVGCIVLTSETFGTKLWEVVSQQIEILIKAGYNVQVYDDDIDIIVIKYAYRDEELTDYRLEWITDEELDYINCLRDEHGSCHCCCDCGGTYSEGSSQDEQEYKQLDLAEASGITWDEITAEK